MKKLENILKIEKKYNLFLRWKKINFYKKLLFLNNKFLEIIY